MCHARSCAGQHASPKHAEICKVPSVTLYSYFFLSTLVFSLSVGVYMLSCVLSFGIELLVLALYGQQYLHLFVLRQFNPSFLLLHFTHLLMHSFPLLFPLLPSFILHSPLFSPIISMFRVPSSWCSTSEIAAERTYTAGTVSSHGAYFVNPFLLCYVPLSFFPYLLLSIHTLPLTLTHTHSHSFTLSRIYHCLGAYHARKCSSIWPTATTRPTAWCATHGPSLSHTSNYTVSITTNKLHARNKWTNSENPSKISSKISSKIYRNIYKN